MMYVIIHYFLFYFILEAILGVMQSQSLLY